MKNPLLTLIWIQRCVQKLVKHAAGHAKIKSEKEMTAQVSNSSACLLHVVQTLVVRGLENIELHPFLRHLTVNYVDPADNHI